MTFPLPAPALMGIINITDQSFYKPSRVKHIDAVIERAALMIKEGAHIIDIGGQSTHPKATAIDEKEEWHHIKDCVTQLPQVFPNTIFSIDTFFSSIAHRALNAGFHIVNDVYAGDYDKNMYSVLAAHKAVFVCTHHLPCQKNPPPRNIVEHIVTFFDRKMQTLKSYGIEHIILDPGIGFGKTRSENFQLLKHLSEFKRYAYPLLVGISRKSFIYETLNISPEAALNGTTFMHGLALNAGADILRIHDVGAAQETLALYEAYKNAQ